LAKSYLVAITVRWLYAGKNYVSICTFLLEVTILSVGYDTKETGSSSCKEFPMTRRLAVTLLWLLPICGCGKGCEKCNEGAVKLEKDGDFSRAYQTYAGTIWEYTKPVEIQEHERFHDGKELAKWIGDTLADLAVHELERPSSECTSTAVEGVRRLRHKLKSIEEYLVKNRDDVELSRDDMVEYIYVQHFLDQDELPKSEKDKAGQLYDESLSIVEVQGDASSAIELIFYNPKSNVTVHGETTDATHALRKLSALLTPGKWIAVMKVIEARSNPADENIRYERNIKGRYSTADFSVPSTPHKVSLQFYMHGEQPTDVERKWLDAD
jgi:hypothetical protein